MKKNQDINKLFQDQLEHFEVLPDEAVWNALQEKLQEKKKRRVIPIWWFYGGVAAAFLVGLFLNLNTNSGTTAPGISAPSTTDGIVNSSPSNQTKTNPSDATDSQNEHVGAAKKGSVTPINSGLPESSLPPNPTSGVVGTELRNNENAAQKSRVQTTRSRSNASQFYKASNAIVTTNKNSGESTQLAVSSPIEKGISNPSVVAVTTPSKNNSTNTEVITKPTVSPLTNESGVGSQNNVNTSAPIVSNNPLNKAKDSIQVAQKPTNELEKLLDEKEKKSFSGQNLNRWQVASNLAPIYFGSLAQGSPLDPSLANNSKQYAVNNTSYGIGVGYALTSKISVRTGVNVVRLGYDTYEIAYYMEPEVSSRIQNLSLNSMGSSIIIESLNNVKTYNKFMERYEGSLNQRMGYLEIPMELTYRLGGKKMGIQFIGGFSTYFLNQNEIYLQSEQFNLLVGKATNLNPMHFSGNLGLGIHYGFFKKWEARIEPVFKYQLNTFSSDAGNFKPYMMGLYSGVSYSF
jgi:hypothetical protein